MYWIKMIGATVTPVAFSVLFYFLDTRTRFGKRPVLHRQIVVGIVFGILACLATQFGIPYDGYMLNVRSAIPLTAGLVFGGPAGLIAGIMGGVYRWCSVWWGVPSYTRAACSIATVLAGVIATLCRKYMFDNKRAVWFYGIYITVATEIFHMILVFLTHMDDINGAFQVVQQIAGIMIGTNSVAVLLALIFSTHVVKGSKRNWKALQPITQPFAQSLFLSVVIGFILSSVFTIVLQNNVSRLDAENLLYMNIFDVEADISDALDRDLLERTENVAENVKSNLSLIIGEEREGYRSVLQALMNRENVSEINIIGPDGTILLSTNPDYDGYDMNSDPDGQAAQFLCLLEGETSYVQDYQPRAYDGTTWRKYAGITVEEGYFVQVGYDKEHFRDAMAEMLDTVAVNRHVGQTGFVFILDLSAEEPLISAPEGTVTNEDMWEFAPALEVLELEDGQMLTYNVQGGESYFFMKDTVEGYVVVGCLPKTEAYYARNISVYISGFMQLFVFFVLFLMVFFQLKRLIVDNIRKVNRSLMQITDGDLNVRVDVQDTAEFASLSNGINTTVDRLKDYISEAEKRMDQELAVAKAIQHSAMPSVFPPFPNRTEFDLYASMDTAKEVGGDFYDFYFLGRQHLVILIADVSGKGIPAAMFMMTAKTIIKSYAESGLPVGEVFTRANETLCESNEAGMFVTAWMGIVNLRTGVIKFANAGHNPPAIRHGDGSFELLRSRPGLVLAGMEGIRYRENETQLQPGDEIFLYTDGVTEATDANNQLLGEERMLITLNAHGSSTAKETCEAVKETIDEFVGEAPQFDDITMLSFKMKTLAEQEGSEI